jgi:hypothetical protein
LGLSDTTQKSSQTTSGKSSTTVPDTPDIIAARQHEAQIDPTIGYRLGEQQRQLKSSFNNPMGGATTGQIRDAVLRSGNRELAQQAGEQMRAGQYDVNRLNQSKDLALAGLTRGQNEDYSGQAQGKIVQSDSPLKTAAAVAGQMGPLSLGA